MSSDVLGISQLNHVLQTSSFLGSMVKKVWQYDARTLVVSFDIAGRAAAMDLAIDQGTVTGSVLARDPQLRRQLRNMLVGKAELVIDSSERHVVGSWPCTDSHSILHNVIDWTHWLTQQPKRAPTEYSDHGTLPRDHVGAFWWDKRSNFGDAVGPWMIGRITGRTPVNSRRVRHDGPTLLSVGSIISFLDRDHASIWGTGLMRPLSGDRLERLQSYEDIKVQAVRGRLTAAELREKLNWQVPDVYGDPALLLPRFYTPRISSLSAGSTVVVPHYSHAKHFTSPITDDALHMVDVAQGLERVVDEIASADSCISTSLHGIIVAQAYGVPWVWLRLNDRQLGGDQFKFNDFFSTLAGEGEGVSRCDVSSQEVEKLDFKSLAQRASLPRLNTSLDDLLSAFPLPSGGPVHRPWKPPRINVRAATYKAKVQNISKFKQLKRLKRLKRVLVEPREVILVDPRKANSPVKLPVENSNAGVEKALNAILKELQSQRRTLETIRVAATSDVVDAVQSFVREHQLGLLETLELLVESNMSFARFGDGEFRLLVRPDFDLRFQRNGAELRQALGSVLATPQDNLLVGFPQLSRDAHWTGIWSELWTDLQPYLGGDRNYGNSHVTRPVAFDSLGDRGTRLWRQIWEDKHVAIVTGGGSRFDPIPELFDNVTSITNVFSSAMNAYDDLGRVELEVLACDVDLALIALGPAGTVLAAKLAAVGLRSLDIDHLSDSYADVFAGVPRPE